MNNLVKAFSVVAILLTSFSSQAGIIAENLTTGVHGKEDVVSLSFNNLNDHNKVKINFDLTMWDSWDGNHWYWGHDNFGMRVDGNTIFEYTFSNFSNAPWAASNPYTETVYGQLGHNSYWWDKFYEDYANGFEIAHSSSDLNIEFYSSGLQSYWDESWEVTNLDVSSVPEPSVIALFGLGLLGLGFSHRRQVLKKV